MIQNYSGFSEFSEMVNTLVAIATICEESTTKFNIYICF